MLLLLLLLMVMVLLMVIGLHVELLVGLLRFSHGSIERCLDCFTVLARTAEVLSGHTLVTDVTLSSPKHSRIHCRYGILRNLIRQSISTVVIEVA